MNKIAIKALLLSTLFAAGGAFAASAGAAFQVGFVVQSSCTVQAPDGAKATAPTVACGRDVPFQVAAQASAAAAPADTAAGAGTAAIVSSDTQAHTATWQISF